MWVSGLFVGGGCYYCCSAVLLLHSPTVTLASRRPLALSIAPSITPLIARRHRRPGVLGPLSSIARRRPIARSRARPPSLTHRHSPAVARPPPPPSLGRSLAAIVARPPSPARSLARRRSFVRPLSLALRRSCLLLHKEYRCRHA